MTERGCFLFHNRLAQAAHRGVHDKPHDGHALVEGRRRGPLGQAGIGAAIQDTIDLIVAAVLREQVVIHGEPLCDLAVLHVLLHEQLINGEPLGLVELDHCRQIVPAAGRHERRAVGGGFHGVEVGALDVQVGDDRRMHLGRHGELAPHVVVGLNLDALQAIPRGDVEVVSRAVVLGRVAGRHDDPAVGHGMAAEDLVLQKLQHGRRERLRYAVDLVEEQNALAAPRGLHRLIDRGDDLAHGVFGHLVFHAVIGFRRDERQAQRALAGMVGHGVGHESHFQFLGDLLHDGRLADARRAQQEHRTLALGRQKIVAELVFSEIGDHGVFDLLFCFADIHSGSSSSTKVSSRITFMAQGGTGAEAAASSESRNTKAVS